MRSDVLGTGRLQAASVCRRTTSFGARTACRPPCGTSSSPLRQPYYALFHPSSLQRTHPGVAPVVPEQKRCEEHCTTSCNNVQLRLQHGTTSCNKLQLRLQQTATAFATRHNILQQRATSFATQHSILGHARCGADLCAGHIRQWQLHHEHVLARVCWRQPGPRNAQRRGGPFRQLVARCASRLTHALARAVDDTALPLLRAPSAETPGCAVGASQWRTYIKSRKAPPWTPTRSRRS
jgi:hypothetical protein